MISGNSPLILVADDEPSMLTLVAQHLRATGYRVLEASDGEQAWTLAREHTPELVVLDVMMPGMSGWEVCRKIREDLTLAPTAVVMLTGIGEHLNEMTSPLYGADEYIDKPFEFSELDSKVRSALEAGMRRNDHPGLARTEPLTSQPPTGTIDDSWQEDGAASSAPPSTLDAPKVGAGRKLSERPKAAAKPKAAKAAKAKPKTQKAKASPKPAAKVASKSKTKGSAKKAKKKSAAKPKVKARTKTPAKKAKKAKPAKRVAKAKAPKKAKGGKKAARSGKRRK